MMDGELQLSAPSRREALQLAAALPLAGLPVEPAAIEAEPAAAPPVAYAAKWDAERKHALAKELSALTGGKVRVEFHPNAAITDEGERDNESKGHQFNVMLDSADDGDDLAWQAQEMWFDDRDGEPRALLAAALRGNARLFESLAEEVEQAEVTPAEVFGLAAKHDAKEAEREADLAAWVNRPRGRVVSRVTYYRANGEVFRVEDFHDEGEEHAARFNENKFGLGGWAVFQPIPFAEPAAEWWDPLESTCRHASLSIL